MPPIQARQTIPAFAAATAFFIFTLVACSGPDEFSDNAETPVAVATSTPVVEASATPTSTAEPSPTPSPELSPTAEESTQTATDETPEADDGTATAEDTPAGEGTAEAEASPTADSDTTPTEESLLGMEPLPRLDEMPEDGYIVADQGERSAEQLAGAYADPTAHLLRLEEWGFRQHVYREFSRDGGENDPLPRYVLATVNVYGSPEQADLAFQWLEDFQRNQGQQSAEAPEIGDAAVALTVSTAQGVPTASVYVNHGSSMYIYYAQGGEPLPQVVELAETVFERIDDNDRQALFEWPS